MIRQVSRLALAGFVLCFAVRAHAHVIVTFEPAVSVVNLGETFTVDIVAEMTLPIVGWGMALTVEQPTVVFPTVAPQIGPLWLPTQPLGNAFGGVAFPNPVMGSGVLLATLTLVATDIGDSLLILSVDDQNSTQGFALLTPGEFDTYTLVPGYVSVIPSPGAALIFVAGLLGPRRNRLDYRRVQY